MVALFWSEFFKEKTFLYFLVTAFRGAFLLLSWINSWYFISFLILMVKMGVWPFSFWVLKVCKSLKFKRIFIFLFLLKILPFYGIFKFFCEYEGFLIFISIVKLIGSTINLFFEKEYKILNVFFWVAIRSTSYWFIIGISSFWFFLIFYRLYRFLMFCLLNFQKKFLKNFNLWMISFLIFLGGPPLFYLFLKFFFFYFLPWNFLYIICLTFIFFFQRIVFIRIFMLSGFNVRRN